MHLTLDRFFEIWSAKYDRWRAFHQENASPESPHVLVWHDEWMAAAMAILKQKDTPKRRDIVMRKRHMMRTAVHNTWRKRDAIRRRLRSASDANPDAAADAASNAAAVAASDVAADAPAPPDAPPAADAPPDAASDAPPDADDAAASNATVDVPPDVARQLALFRLAMQLVNTASNATAYAPPGAPHAPHAAPPDAPHPPATGQPGVLHPPATGRLSKATRNRQRRRKAVNTARIWHAAGV